MPLSHDPCQAPEVNPGRSDALPMCVKGCGFYGNPATGSMCSKCYKQSLQSGEVVSTPEVSAPTALRSEDPPEPAPVVEEAKEPAEKEISRCGVCNKHLGIVQRMVCKCGGTFCPKHSFSELHSCSYDFRAEHQQMLTKSNRKCDFKKVDKI